MRKELKKLCFLFVLLLAHSSHAHPIKELVAKVKPSVVGVGLYDALGTQVHRLRGTGFVVGDGTLVATNYHVVNQPLDPERVQYLIVFAGTGRKPQIHKATIVASDPKRDLAILKIPVALAPANLAANTYVDDGTEVLLTGFPIGAVLGLYPATHKGIVAATTPDVIPSHHSSQLSANVLNRLADSFMIYQLDITAYPGNSGSPLYDAYSGDIIGVLNKVFVKESKESVLEAPSGISYAIPIRYLHDLAKNKSLELTTN